MRKLVVCGATGTQGGNVIEAMRDQDEWELHAFSRDPNSAKVKKLQNDGVKVSQADLLDLDSLIKIFDSTDCVFGVTQPWNKAYTKCDTQAEMEQGQNIVLACKETGIKHLVLSTAAHLTDDKMGLPHVDIKIDIEEYAKKSGIPLTILKPAQFMDNIGMKFLPVKKGKIRGFIDGNAKVPYVATRDIGVFAKIALKNPDDYIGEDIKLIGDFFSGYELADTMGQIREERFKYTAVPKWMIWLYSREFYAMRIAFEDFAMSDMANLIPHEIEKCKAINPDLMSVEQYLKYKGWGNRQ